MKKCRYLAILVVFAIFISLNLVSSSIDYTKYYMFITNNSYSGNLGGRYGADAICNIEVPYLDTSRPTAGNYRAYISTDGEYPGTTIEMDSTRAIYNYRTDGVSEKIADNYIVLENGIMDNSPWPYGGNLEVWTGISSSNNQEKDCSGWTNNENEAGYSGFPNLGNWAEHSSDLCSSKFKIYCVGPFEGEPINYCGDNACDNTYESCLSCPQDCGLCNSGAYYMFVTSSSYNGSLGGIEGANEKCNYDSNRPGPIGTYKAFISTNENYPVLKGMKTNLPIYSVETLKKIANDYYDLIDLEIENPIAPFLRGTRIWTRGYETCNNWTNSDDSKTAFSSQYSFGTSSSWWDESNPSSCNEKHNLYCIGPLENYEVFYCGDGIIQTNNDEGKNEQCDDGKFNANTCTPAYGGSCSYCSKSCVKQTILGNYCGDKICNSVETCSSCSNDCGTCSITPSHNTDEDDDESSSSKKKSNSVTIKEGNVISDYIPEDIKIITEKLGNNFGTLLFVETSIILLSFLTLKLLIPKLRKKDI